LTNKRRKTKNPKKLKKIGQEENEIITLGKRKTNQERRLVLQKNEEKKASRLHKGKIIEPLGKRGPDYDT